MANVLPASCVFCGGPPGEGDSICSGCRSDLPRMTTSVPLVSPLTSIVAPFEYAFPVDAAIKAMKFRRRLAYAPAFASLLMGALTEVPDDIDALLPMPLHWLRHATRGFNQAMEIARPIQRRTGLPLVAGVHRHRRTPFQSGLTASQRKRNLASAFRASTKLNYEHVLIIDDVITTGATCRELAKVLLAAGAGKVSVLAVAQALPD